MNEALAKKLVRKNSGNLQKLVIDQKVEILSRQAKIEINKEYQDKLENFDIMGELSFSHTAQPYPITTLKQLEGDDSLFSILKKQFCMTREFPGRPTSTYYRAVAYGFIEQIVMKRN